MAVKDQEKTAFITPFGAFCYVSMPFGLKSAQATYQRCVQNSLHNQIGCNVHAYVDDIVVKSREKETLIDYLKETFDNKAGPLSFSSSKVYMSSLLYC